MILQRQLRFLAPASGLDPRTIDQNTISFGTGSRGVRICKPQRSVLRSANDVVGPVAGRHFAIDVSDLNDVVSRLDKAGCLHVEAPAGDFDGPAIYAFDPALNVVAFCQATKPLTADLQLWEKARLGQKGRVCHMWWTRGVRPVGVCDRRFTFADIFGAVKIGSDDAFALVMPEANTEAMQIILDAFSKTLPVDEIAVMFADQAGWHGANALNIPANLRLLKIPVYTPEVNPVERVWLYLKERYLSHRLHADYDGIVNATCDAWNKLRCERIST